MTVLDAAQPKYHITLRTRVVATGVLLLCEYLTASALIDATVMNRLFSLPEGTFSLGMLGPLVLAIATAIIGLRGEALLREFRAARDHDRVAVVIAAWLLAHIACFAVALGIPYYLTAVQAAPETTSVLWLITWCVSSVLALIAGTQLVMPWRVWRSLARRMGLSIVIGTLVGVAAWAGAMSAGHLWGPLGWLTLHSVAAVLSAITPDVRMVASENLIAIRDFAVVIAPQCAGYEGIGLIAVYLIALLYVLRYELRLPRALLIIPLGIALVWMANVVRLSALVWIGGYWSPEIALNGFHSKSGWVLFCAVALLMGMVARRSTIARLPDEAATLKRSVAPSAAYLLPLVALMASSLMTGTFAAGYDPFYPVAYLVAAATFLHYRSEHRSVRPSWHWAAPATGIAVAVIWVSTLGSAAPEPHPVMASGWPAAVIFAWLAIRIIGSIAIVPVIEELAFRGYLLRRFTAPDFHEVSLRAVGWGAILASSLAFGLLHQRWIVGVIAGLLFAWTAKRTGRLSDAIVAHAVANAGIAAYAVTTGHWSLIG